jgi:hypothetical protein
MEVFILHLIATDMGEMWGSIPDKQLQYHHI